MQVPRSNHHWRKRQIYDLIRHIMIATSPPASPIRIGILVFPSCLPSCAVTPADVFQIANSLLQSQHASPLFAVQWCSVQGGVLPMQGGLSFASQKLVPEELDVLLVPGIVHQHAEDLWQSVAQLQAEQAALCRCFYAGKIVAANCSSTFLLANAGLLDGKRATTSWWLTSSFQQRFHQVQLASQEMIVQDGNLLTSGGVSGVLDLALHLLAMFAGEEMRQMTAKLLVADSHRASQTPYVSRDLALAMTQGAAHSMIARAQQWLREHLDQAWELAQLANYCHTSPRTLLRHFQKELGTSPILYMQQLRVERAKALLESSLLPLEELTSHCGYQDVSTFSKVFKRWVHITPREYRARFGKRH